MEKDSQIQIESLQIKNYKVFKNLNISRLPSFCIIVGANGTGKSTFFDIFGFLQECLISNVNNAVQRRGGFRELLSRHCDENDDVETKLQYRMPLNGKPRLVTYFLKIGRSAQNAKHKIIVKQERLAFKRGAYGSPYNFLDFTEGQGEAVTNEKDFDEPKKRLKKEQHKMESPDILAIKGIGQLEKFKAASAFRSLLENWHVSDFHINMARGSKESVGDFEHLSVSADNLQLVAKHIYENYPDVFEKMINRMKRCVPGIGGVTTMGSPDGRLLLGFQDGSFKDPFIDKFVSDGTLKIFAYLVLLYDPKPHKLLCVEEPENQLYPALLESLAEEFRHYSRRGGQVLVSTHSYDFLNAAKVNEVFWLEKENGQSRLTRASDDPQIVEYMKNGDKMGWLWREGFFKGATLK
ncbi:MAG: AAA family ATPase [Planctomycetaceae bacterium]|jgi:predicted ATPase|nr:AAA family ATPase [Planctomycetaceae bacterium]